MSQWRLGQAPPATTDSLTRHPFNSQRPGPTRVDNGGQWKLIDINDEHKN